MDTRNAGHVAERGSTREFIATARFDQTTVRIECACEYSRIDLRSITRTKQMLSGFQPASR